jgi:AcrR family transcriptional regulator
MPRPKQRTPELRGRVLDAAVSALAGEGIAAFTTRRVAAAAATSIPAVYELFGDRAGLLREVFFEGFRRLGARFAAVTDTGDPRSDLGRVVEVFRAFVQEQPVLAELMFSRPFSDFDPVAEELEAGATVRRCIVGHVERCVRAGILAGDATDIAHVLVAVAQGLAAQETAGFLGSTKESVDRRWALAFRLVLDGASAHPLPRGPAVR